MSQELINCSFCDSALPAVQHMIKGREVVKGIEAYICDECIINCQGVLTEQREAKSKKKNDGKEKLTPEKIVKYLDQYVIGQTSAKKLLAVAVYNHYKRIGKKLDVEIQKSNILMVGPTGCHAKGQGIMMADGSIKKVEDVLVGDQLMGPDSTSRHVLELYHGQQQMVNIIPKKGDLFVVNLDHVLTLVTTDTNEIVDITVREYLTCSKTFKRRHKLFRVPIEFEEKELPLDPYLFGTWLGDGYSHRGAICSADVETITEWAAYAYQNNLELKDISQCGKAIGVGLYQPGYHKHVNPYGDKTKINPFVYFIKKFNLKNNKHIPHIFLTSSMEQRLQLLAGIIDTDGHLQRNCYEIATKSDLLAKDIIYLARSVGLAAYDSVRKKKCYNNGKIGTYHIIGISGHTDMVPCKLIHKKATVRKQKKDVMRTGFSVETMESDDYFGFSLDGDNRYLLDDFTVTHNSGKTYLVRHLAKLLDVPFTQADATTLTEAGYVGDDVDMILGNLVNSANGDIAKAQHGIIYIDEIDKIAAMGGNGRDVKGEGVQQALLKMLEGSVMQINPQGGKKNPQGPLADINTTDILFICGGAFSGLTDIQNKKRRLGLFQDEENKEGSKDLSPSQIIKYGMIPEFVGRLPIIAKLELLKPKELYRILIEPQNSLVRQYQALFNLDGIDLDFTDEFLLGIAEKSFKDGIGARGLRSIMEKALSEHMFKSPGKKIKKLTIGLETLKPELEVVR